MHILLSEQVVSYVRSLPPVPKKRVREALEKLNQLEGDLKDLHHPLEGYCRLRVHQYRIILKIENETIQCVFIEKRSLVYEIFEQTLLS